MTDLEALRTAFEQAEQHAQWIMAEKDAKLNEIGSVYDDRLRHANLEAAQAQKRLADAEAADALKDEPDGDVLAEALGLSLRD